MDDVTCEQVELWIQEAIDHLPIGHRVLFSSGLLLFEVLDIRVHGSPGLMKVAQVVYRGRSKLIEFYIEGIRGHQKKDKRKIIKDTLFHEVEHCLGRDGGHSPTVGDAIMGDEEI
ncbi:hypothetical protein LCGC14_1257930 [marine sediment metagenome]|uniref:Uncharacterized protein n=1 Tax=marine sediment metagenome TaxID=412755 RepID=A0A0F9L1G6_9ZZZZ|nr:hypothetical protein [Candidatus Aminicenantes bacterium]